MYQDIFSSLYHLSLLDLDITICDLLFKIQLRILHASLNDLEFGKSQMGILELDQ